MAAARLPRRTEEGGISVWMVTWLIFGSRNVSAMNEYLGGTLLENGEEELGAEYEAWLDEVESVMEGIGGIIFVDDFPVWDDEDDEEDDLVY
jgi:hypothetical protein